MDITTQFKNGAAAVALAAGLASPALAQQDVGYDAPQQPTHATRGDEARQRIREQQYQQQQPQQAMTAGDACREMARSNFQPFPLSGKGFSSAGNLGCAFTLVNGQAMWTQSFDLNNPSQSRQFANAVDTTNRQERAMQDRQARQGAAAERNATRGVINDVNQGIGTARRALDLFRR